MEEQPSPRTWFVRYLKRLVQTSPRRCAAALALSIAATVTESFGLLLLLPLIAQIGIVSADSDAAERIGDVLSSVGIPNTLGWILITYIGLIAIRAAVESTRRVVFADLAYRLENDLRADLFESVAAASWSFHLRRRGSDLALILGSELARVRSGTSAVFDVAARAIASLGYLVVALRLSPAVSGVAAMILAAAGLALWPAVRRSRRTGELQTKRGLRTFAEQQQFLDNVKVVKSHGDEQRHVDLYRAGLDRLRASLLDFARVSAVSNGTLQVVVAGAIALVTWIAVTQLDTSGPRLIVLIVVIVRLAPVVSSLLEQGQVVGNMLPAFTAAWTWTADARRDAERAGPIDGGAFPTPRDDIRLEAVSYSYEPDRRALDDVSLRIPIGSVVGVVGPSGAGKTTLVDVALGLLQPDEGSLLVDGIEIGDDQLTQWRRHVGYVPQDTSLFHATIRSNITLSDAELSPAERERLDQLVELVALGPLISSIPDGLDTVVGDRGTRLSGGERQRVALARALWRQPALLVLDEATSALDRGHEQLVLDAIDASRGQIAILVVAHRLDTIRHADEIVVVDDGSIVARGGWDDLRASNAVFASLVGGSEPDTV